MKRAPYELVLESRVPGTRPRYEFSTADGVCSKREFRPAELLLVESLWNADLGRCLCLAANYGVAGVVLADHSASAVHMVESSARASQLCERNATENAVDASTSLVTDVSTLEASFDTVAYAPKPYTSLLIGRQRIADALEVLEPGGGLYLAASRETGLSRYERCLGDIAASVERVTGHDGYSILRASRPRSYEPPSYVTPRAIRPEIDGTEVSLRTVPGLFSSSRLDEGTRLLLETITVENGETVLDVCCGYGAIGTYIARTTDCDVWLSDDDAIATACAECSLRASRVDGTTVTADCTEGVADRTFDRVLCNPPTHAGSGVLSELFAGVHDVLAPDGELEIVHHRALNLDTFLSPFDTAETLRKENGYVVLRVTD